MIVQLIMIILSIMAFCFHRGKNINFIGESLTGPLLKIFLKIIFGFNYKHEPLGNMLIKFMRNQIITYETILIVESDMRYNIGLSNLINWMNIRESQQNYFYSCAADPNKLISIIDTFYKIPLHKDIKIIIFNLYYEI